MASCVITVKLIDSSFTERVQANLANDHRLEAVRIEAALEQYLSHARGLSYSTELRRLLDQVYAIRNNTRELALSDIDELEDYTKTKKSTLYSRTNQSTYSGVKDQLEQKMEDIRSNAEMIDSGVTELQLILPTGAIVGQTTGFSWQPNDASIFEKVPPTAKPIFGNAFLNPRGQARLPIVVPMFNHSTSNTTSENSNAQLLGLLMLEYKLEPVVDLVGAHEGFGSTIESHIVHRNPDGDTELITPMRFARGAAFKKVVSNDQDLPINWSLSSPERKVVRSPDYRGIDSILAISTLPQVGWGLIVKMDADEAFSAVAKVKQVIWSAGIISVVLILLSWLALFGPLTRRVKTAAAAADRLAAGDFHNLIDDSETDEIGTLAKSIDSLATDLNRNQMQREAAEQQLKHQAEHDDLTGLINRKHTQDLIIDLDHSSTTQTNSFIFLDLDGFKQINDQHGHYIGDEILIATSAQISALVGDECSVGRWGGDEFVIIAPNTNKINAQRISKKISKLFNTSFPTSVGDQKLGCSIGTSTTNHIRSMANCVQLADKNMYQAKQLRKQANEESVNKSTLVRSAMAEKRAQIWYQPIVKSTTERGWVIVGAEALLRLHDNSGKQIPTDKVIPDIHNLDVSTELDAYALSCVCNDYKNWRAANLINSDFYCSVNLSSHTVQTTRFPELLQTLLNKHHISPSSLLMEFSEKSEKINIDMVAAIKALGVGVAVDDFGVANSNLDRLAQIAPNVVKIDRTWITEIDSDPKAADIQDLNERKSVILANIISTCSELNITCVVEGLERQSQIQPLKNMGADKFQGFLFDAALPGEQFIQKLQNHEISQRNNAGHVKLKRAS